MIYERMAETNGLSDRCNKMDVIDALLMECFHRPDSVCVAEMAQV